jgi:S-adenosylmethionine:tRNA ribosyltransferase-isomerase
MSARHRRPMSELTRADFYFELPEELIAQEPVHPRDSSRLLHLHIGTGEVTHHIFRDLPDILNSDVCLVVNDSKVIRARLWAQGETGQTEELFLLRQLHPSQWEVLGSWDEGTAWSVQDIRARSLGPCQQDSTTVEFTSPIYDRLEQMGEIPLPPYVKSDKGAAGYQTVYAKVEGSVAAPTAGLHFTESVLQRLADKGIQKEIVTLHVGYGTFAEVKPGALADHVMHKEFYSLSPETAERLNAAKQAGKTILSVGTSATRVLESRSKDGVVTAGTGETGLFIYPPYRWQFVDAMLTNFHMPDRSPLMLVAALAGREPVLEAYRQAIEERYRFYSFGDSMLVYP